MLDPVKISTWLDNIGRWSKSVTAALAVFAAVITAWVYLDLPQPVSLQYVDLQFKTLSDRGFANNLRLIDAQLSINNARRERLRAEKFELELKLREDARDAESKRIVTTRLQAIDDELEEVNRERKRLLEERDKAK